MYTHFEYNILLQKYFIILVQNNFSNIMKLYNNVLSSVQNLSKDTGEVLKQVQEGESDDEPPRKRARDSQAKTS